MTIGDKVLVHKDIENISGTFCCEGNTSMTKYCGEVVTITGQPAFNEFYIEEDQDTFPHVWGTPAFISLPINQHNFDKYYVHEGDIFTTIDGEQATIKNLHAFNRYYSNSLEVFNKDTTDLDIYSITRNGVTIFQREV